jgi:hypothetical protein
MLWHCGRKGDLLTESRLPPPAAASDPPSKLTSTGDGAYAQVGFQHLTDTDSEVKANAICQPCEGQIALNDWAGKPCSW